MRPYTKYSKYKPRKPRTALVIIIIKIPNIKSQPQKYATLSETVMKQYLDL